MKPRAIGKINAWERWTLKTCAACSQRAITTKMWGRCECQGPLNSRYHTHTLALKNFVIDGEMWTLTLAPSGQAVWQ